MYRSAKSKSSAGRAGLVLGAWTLAIAALALLGTGIEERLAPTSLLVPGTQSARAHATLEREFGNAVPVTVLLEGPPAAVDDQGPRLAGALRRERGVEVMSPWDGSGAALRSLRPRRGVALLIASFQRPESKAMSEVVPAAKRIVATNVHRPLRAHVGGVAAIATALQENALAATRHAEMLVAPILVIVLLLVFRSPVAAAIPLVMGAATVLAGRGLLLLSTYAMPVNAIAVAMASMMGLALGVDYALLMVSRFRQERDAGAGAEAAIATAAHAAGQTIVFAGGTLALVMVAAALIAPGDLLGSVAAGVVVSTVLSVLLAVSMLPSLLRVLAPHLERWRLPSAGRSDRLLRVARAVSGRPGVAIALIAGPMLAIAMPAHALTIGPPDPRQLPPSDPTRRGFEALRRAIGPGWAAPIAIVVAARRGPITEPGRLEALSRWQDRLARDPDVAAVIGPASLRQAERPLARARRAYREAPARLARAERGLAALRSGLLRASNGVARLRRGLGAGANGARAIASGTRQAQRGAERLGAGLARAGAGAHRLSGGLKHAERGAERLEAGQRRLGRGARRLARGLRRLDETLRSAQARVRAVSAQVEAWSGWLRSLRVPTELAAARLDGALRELEAMAGGGNDPRYARLVEAVREGAALVGGPAGGEAALPPGVSQSLAASLVDIQERLAGTLDSLASLPEQLDQLVAGVGKLRRGGDRVAAGARRPERGARAIRRALGRLARGGERLDRGLARAPGGAGRLADGLAAVAAGADRLAADLGRGRERTGSLSRGLAKPRGPLSHYAVVLHGYRRDLRALRSRSPRAIDSGYLLLTALDGAAPELREQASQLVNLDRGGRTVRMLVVPRSGPSSAATVSLSERLQRELPALARVTGAEVAIGEGAQSLADYTDATIVRIPWLVAALCLVSTLALIAVLRSLLLPVIAVSLNLLTVVAAFGALQLLFELGLLVGPHYIDAISAAGVLTIMFVLSIDYEVFLLTRTRELWLRSSDHTLAIEQGLRSTAGVITGAATIMCSVFLAFATADIASLQQFGAGLAFAVALDATLVRLVLLPAIMRALGRRAWWLPAWLDRCIPEIEHGSPSAAGDFPPAAATASARQRLEAVAHEEHRLILDLLAEAELAGERRQPDRVVTLVREARELAQPHFSYEQRALFPQLVESVGPAYIADLRGAQGGVVEALARVEELAGEARVHESAAAETRRLLRSARAAIVSCDALCSVIGRQDEDVARQVLAAREQALGARAPRSGGLAVGGLRSAVGVARRPAAVRRRN